MYGMYYGSVAQEPFGSETVARYESMLRARGYPFEGRPPQTQDPEQQAASTSSMFERTNARIDFNCVNYESHRL